MSSGWQVTDGVLQDRVVVSGNADSAAAYPAWPGVLFIVWLTGCLIVGTLVVIGIFSARRLAHKSVPADKRTLQIAASQADDLRLTGRYRVRFIDAISIPVVFGLWIPTILLPVAASEWPEERINLILRHELAHLKRHDCLWLRLVLICTLVHWFNPLVWMARKRLIAESEFACGDSILETGAASADYARHLLVTMIALALALPIAVLSWDIKKDEKNLPGPDDFVEIEEYPRMIYQEAPIYPDKAKQAGIEGDVWVKSPVDTSGAVRKALPGKTSGNDLLDKSAIRAARR